MAVYHQMGHNSENLVGEIEGYAGVILSPVNASSDRMANLISRNRSDGCEFIFDPQLYSPRSEHQNLHDWSYFPDDVDTADLSSHEWWASVSQDILGVCAQLNVDAACSPALVPNRFDRAFFRISIDTANDMKRQANSIDVLQTIVVRFGDLTSIKWVMELASIVSSTECDRVYLILLTEEPPRRELRESEPLTGALRLVSELAAAGIPPLVGFCGPESILYMQAGAAGCATGKFFNLRRFTPGRFEEPSGAGGGQLSYWFEERLLAYLREADLRRVQDRFGTDFLSEASRRNPYGNTILDKLDSEPGTAWLGDSWRHYMHWFVDVQGRLVSGETGAEDLLEEAEAAWGVVQGSGLLMEEARNDGSWIRPWRIALREHLRND